MTRAADDVDFIAKRLKELEEEKQSILSQPIDEPVEETPAEDDAVTAYWKAQGYDPWKKLAEDLAGKRGPSQPVEPSGWTVSTLGTAPRYTIIKVNDDYWKVVITTDPPQA